MLPVRPASEIRLTPTSQPPVPPGPLYGGTDDDDRGVPFSRRLSAIRRYWWLIAALTVVGATAGFVATRFVKPTYEARATIWIQEVAPPTRDQTGPIRGREMLTASSWVELFKSFTIVDSVVMQLGLHVTPDSPRDSSMFRGVTVDNSLLPNRYVLSVDTAGRTYTLATEAGRVVETGAVGDSVGRSIGMSWAPDPDYLLPNRSVTFEITTPRNASLALLDNLRADLEPTSNFMRLTLSGDDPVRTARALNLWSQVFVSTALELKRRNLTEFSRILEGQLAYAEQQLRSAETSLLTFRVNTVTLPAETAPLIPGLELTKGPVFTEYFDRKQQLDQIRRQRQALQQVLARGSARGPDPLAIASIPGLLEFPGARELSDVWKELFEKQAQLRALQRNLTDENPRVVLLAEEISTLRTQTLPRMASAVLTQLQQSERSLGGQIEAQGVELRGIPTRAIEEMRLTREMKVAENLYTSLQARYAEAKLTENSSVPDVVSLDQASPPDQPATDATYRVLLIVILGGLVLGVLIALLLDQRDNRFRYVDQVGTDLRLPIIGAVPSLKLARGQTSLEDVDGVVEAFRGLRLRLQHSAAPDGRIACAITSALSGDGKSIVSANLALSFAEAGYRTVLVDGDTRRGELNQVFGVRAHPGLIESLQGKEKLEDCLQPTTHPQLMLLAGGARGRHNPDALADQSLGRLLSELRSQFDAVIVDTPALTAGIDGFALGAECGNILLVMRCARTDLRATMMKLDILRRLPVNIHGVVLNDVHPTGEYRYYAYATSYAGAAETAAVGGNGAGNQNGKGSGRAPQRRVLGAGVGTGEDR